MSLGFMWGVIFVIAYVAGFTTSMVITRNKTANGTLLIDNTNPEKKTWRFEIDEKQIDHIDEKKRFVLKIDHDAKLSQE